MESPVCHRLHETPPGDIPGAFFIASAPLRLSQKAPPMARPVSASRPRRGLRSWLAVRWTRTPAHRSPGGHSSDPGIRGPLHPLLLRCPPSPYRSGYASVGRLSGSGASILSMHGLFRNDPPEAGPTAPSSFGLLRPLRAPLRGFRRARVSGWWHRRRSLFRGRPQRGV